MKMVFWSLLVVIAAYIVAIVAAVDQLRNGTAVVDQMIDVVDYTQLKIFDATNGSYLRSRKAWGEFNQPGFQQGKHCIICI
jgi:hypothetical protein